MQKLTVQLGGAARVELIPPARAAEIQARWDAADRAPRPPEAPGLEQRVSALETRLAALEKGRP